MLAACAATLLTACARTVVTNSLPTNAPPDDETAQLDFWDALTTHGIVSNDEGLHGLFLLADSGDTSGSYQTRVERAKQRGWLDAGFDEPSDLAMQRGTLARAITSLCGIEGGLWMHVFGPTPRYATRELISMGMMAPGTEQQSFTGREFIGIITKAQDYLALRRLADQNEKRDAP